MSATFRVDGSALLVGEADPSRTEFIPGGISLEEREAAILAFFAHEPRPVPETVSNYQARQALIDAGLFAKADAMVRASGDVSTIQAWDQANFFYRSSPFIARMGAALGMTQADIDDLFRAAEQVP